MGTDGGVAYLASKVEPTGGFGTLMQYVDAKNYVGKRVRFEARVKSEGVGEWAGLWMRVDKGEKAVAFDNMEKRAIKGTTAWETYDVVLDVPADATGIGFGTLATGSREVWMDHVSLEVVGKDVAVTDVMAPRVEETMPRGPVNLDFRK